MWFIKWQCYYRPERGRYFLITVTHVCLQTTWVAVFSAGRFQVGFGF